MARPKLPPKPPRRSIEERNALVISHMPLVKYIARDYLRRFPWRGDDIIQQGNLGLIQAAAAWDETYGTKFSSYAGKAIACEIVNFLRIDSLIRTPFKRPAMKRSNALKMSAVFTSEEPECYALAVLDADTGLRKLIEWATMRLCMTDPRTGAVFRRYCQGVKTEEIGQEFGIEKATVHTFVWLARQRLRELLPPGDELL